MPCFHPITGYRSFTGGITWSPRLGYVDFPMTVPCGQCVGCRLERSRQWAVRIMHEASMHDYNVFLTLTYDDAHLPNRSSLDRSHFQKFMKRLRKFFTGQRISYFHCGEYGDQNGRPHFHSIVFNCWFSDRIEYSRNGRGEPLYTSETLARLWPFGLAVIGEVTFDSAAYCARYIMKKITGDLADSHYRRVDEYGEVYYLEPEYCTMSLKPGIGKLWYQKFGVEIEDNDSIVVRGVECVPPRYYDKLRLQIEDVKRKRMKRAYKRRANSSPARLKVRETVKLAQINFLGRKL